MIIDYLKLAVENIKTRQLRSWLTMIGIFIGIAAVVTLYSLGQGMESAINEQFEKLGGNRITVQPGGSMYGPPGTLASAKITEHDLDIIEKIRSVDEAAGVIISSVQAEYNDEARYLFIRGVPTNERYDLIHDMFLIEMEEGVELQKGDKKKVMVGYNLGMNDDKFGKKLRIRDHIMLNGQSFEVVGILEKEGDSLQDNILFVPLDSARELMENNKDEFDMIVVTAKEGEDINDVANDINKEMRQDRDQDEGEEDFVVETAEKLLESFSKVFNIIKAVILGLTAISLVIGGIGIMNTMFTAVLERKKEIGILKAVGARNSSIMTLFLFEAGILGALGGGIGAIIGILLSKGIEYVGHVIWGSYLVRAEFSLGLLAGVIAFSFIVGCISGGVPAYQASKLKPVDTLRD